MQLTERDLRLMYWINSIGYVTIEHIVTWLNISYVTAYARLRKLVNNGYLLHERIFHCQPGIYRVSHEGAKICSSPLPPLRKVVLSTYKHDITTTSLGLTLTSEKGCEFIPERLLRHIEGKSGFGDNNHIADGVLIKNDEKIAVEVELTKKSARRREKIMFGYLKNIAYKEVWYFCNSGEVMELIKKMQPKFPFLRVYRLDDFLDKDIKYKEVIG